MGLLRILGAFGPHTMDLVRFGKGFHTHTATVDQFQWSYLTRPAVDPKSREIVVFLHGLGASKEAWVRVASGLAKNYHVVIPDLPGHGKTTPFDPHINFAADRQARRLHEFFESELYPNNKVHLVGTCMGATIAGVVTLSDVEDLGKFTLVSPTETTMTTELGESRHRLPSSESMHTPRILQALAISKRGRGNAVLHKVVVDMLANPTILEDELYKIRAKTMVVWGEQDEVLDVSCLKMIDEKLNITRKEVLVLDKCGHLIQNDKPEECVDVLNKFLADEELSFTFVLAGQESVVAF
ncbi:hypothetical protein BBO99_00004483 [Phytophthora kernoviae]|uniref:AB hydrolase-1 domain-containing protein n=2 Tax=Phytophthora kernoviae TaxID=325452 RepID=A0A3R7JUP6_9STRA|nr:hypothetical protein G195_004508 [Phytophthora kernoviae 00238/432]KAG2525768.1 hypothetical protein JM16_004238 [Phytophthora kernoviae]KAG2527536.1 hypothetical protein JM18_003760 [Phytophthora kernoviae]RLN14086.1 hypothetical protein BBI17_004574 [Phytophthora kernoviae]RLN80453.1 hypothetical protein BBO99_00004483 [Phytophthora kernoviae]